MWKECLALVLSLALGAALASGQTPPPPGALPPGALPPRPVPVLDPAPAPGPPPPSTPIPVSPAPAATPAPATPGLLPVSYVQDVPPAPPGPPIVVGGGPEIVLPTEPRCGPDAWLQFDFLLWFIKDGPLNVPLVTTGSTSDANPGALGQPHTQVLYGNNNLDFGAFPGGRLEGGVWFDAASRFGLEGSGFALSQRAVGFSAFSDSGGNPVLSVPFFNAQTGHEDQTPIAYPGSFAGGVVVVSTSELWGLDLNGTYNVWRGQGLEVNLLGGIRYLNLLERFDMQTPDVSLANTSGTSGINYNTIDDFRAQNQFVGGQLGARAGYQWDRLSVDLTAKVALGSTYQSLHIDGLGVASGGSVGSPQVSPGGIFAQPTNMGRYWAWDFTVVPEGELKIGYRVWRNLSVTAGYDFIYWSSVVRPGQQINRDVNLSQSGVLGAGTLSGPALPVAPLSRTDFFAHGLTLGLDFRW